MKRKGRKERRPHLRLDRVACTGPVCKGKHSYPRYYFVSSGICCECHAALTCVDEPAPTQGAQRFAESPGRLASRLRAAGLSQDESRALVAAYFDGLSATKIARLPQEQCIPRTIEYRLQRGRAKIEAAGMPLPIRRRRSKALQFQPETLSLLYHVGNGVHSMSQAGHGTMQRSQKRACDSAA